MQDSSETGRSDDMVPPQADGSPALWVTAALARVPLPQSPIREPWEFSASAVIGPHMPRALRLGPRLLDYLGQIRLTSQGISVDQRTDIAWKNVREIRTRPLLEVLAITTVDRIAAKTTFCLPSVPGIKNATTWAAHKAADTVLSLFLIANRDSAQGAEIQVPVAIHYSDKWGRLKSMTPGLLSTAALSLPQVANSVLTTATACGVRIVCETPPPSGPAAERAVEALRERTRLLADRITALRRSAPDEAETDHVG